MWLKGVLEWAMSQHTGTICKLGPNFGFIKLDGPGAGDMFVIPQACHAFGRQVPPVGTRVKFQIVTDSKTGRPRAENVQPSDDSPDMATMSYPVHGSYPPQGSYPTQDFNKSLQSQYPAEIQAALSPEILAGLSPELSQVLASPDVASLLRSPEMASLMMQQPQQQRQPDPAQGFSSLLEQLGNATTGLGQTSPALQDVAPLSAAPTKSVGGPSDANSGMSPEVAYLMELADPNSRMEVQEGQNGDARGASSPATHYQSDVQYSSSSDPGSLTGMVVRNNESFGFIKQDNGDADMFVLPPIPPVGTHVQYVKMIDPKTGRPRAENVQAISDGAAQVSHAAPGQVTAPAQSTPQNDEAEKALAILRAAGLPTDMESVQQLMEQITDQLQGLQSQQHQQPFAPAQPAGVAGAPDHGKKTGVVVSINGNFGFIKQDSGEADMFALPPFPQVGTRVTYITVVDPRNGRTRAENIQVENPGEAAALAAAGFSYGPVRGPGGGGHRDAPYALRPNNAMQAVAPVSHGEHLMSGTISKVTDKFCFIAQDIGGPDMFCIPPSCEAFGREMPPRGTRVVYRVVTDAKSGRPRAENVMPGE